MKQDIVPFLMSGLQSLEYRGYDSAGLAVLNKNDEIEDRKATGKLKNLSTLLTQNPLSGKIGIAHTRWATHGKPLIENTHPHLSASLSLVHNGIIENYSPLRDSLKAQGYVFSGQTDSECLAHLIDSYVQQNGDPLMAVQQALAQCEGSYAIAVLFKGENDMLIGARRGSPLVVGLGKEDTFIASDTLALSSKTSQFVYLEEGDMVKLTATSAVFYDEHGNEIQRPVVNHEHDPISATKGAYKHYMLKEIHEQPQTLQQTLSFYFCPTSGTLETPRLPITDDIEALVCVACGTAYYAGMVAKYWFEDWLHIPVYLEVASEFRYHKFPFSKKTLAVFISQSGETADTLASFRFVKSLGIPTLSIVNNTQSSLARETDSLFPIHCGPEIGVASTKAFTSQLVSLMALGLGLAKKLKRKDMDFPCIFEQLIELPTCVQKVLSQEKHIQDIAQRLSEYHNALYLGRRVYFPIALEGALKLKEISYIHAEAYAAGELKHGPIALVDKTMPIVTVAPFNDLFEKTLSSVEEVMARGGQVLLITDEEGEKRSRHLSDIERIVVPQGHDITSVFTSTVVVQLLAYHAAVYKGTDVDQPRNLAKSVTVE